MSGATHQIRVLPPSFYTPYISELSKSRVPSPIRSLFPLENRPGIISLLAGKPNPTAFPFQSLSFSATVPSDSPGESQKYIDISLSQAELAEGLQYGPTAGIPSLVRWITELQEKVHARTFRKEYTDGDGKDGGWRITIGNGSQDLLYKAFYALINPGEAVLVESPAYAGVLPIFQALNCEVVAVQTDSDGIRPSHLKEIFESWPASKPKPRILYTVPYGCNPSGVTATAGRRTEVLQLSREHNFLVLEDDPYYYLYFGDKPRPPSYFSLEAQVANSDGVAEVGRVIRFDSLSKILSAGIRIGFATGPSVILDKIDTHTATANLQPPSLTQAIVAPLLAAWTHTGFLTHTRSVASFYRTKRDIFARAMEREMTGLAEWGVPEAGMFFWFRLLIGVDGDGAVEDSDQIVRTRAFERGVLALPGAVFMPGGEKTGYVRASFSLLEEADVQEAVKRLRSVVEEERKERGLA